MIKNTLFVVPPNVVPTDKVKRIGEPIGVLSIATYLNTRGINSYVYDMTIDGYENNILVEGGIMYGDPISNIDAKIESLNPEFIGVSCMFNSRIDVTIEICRRIKELRPDIVTAVGGLPATMEYNLFLDSKVIDYVIFNDGEVRIEKLINNLNNGKEPEYELDGIAYYKEGQLINIPSKELNKYFSSLPYVDRSLIDMEKCFAISRPYAPYNDGRRTAHIVASKGCPFNCVFCTAVKFVGHKVHFRKLDLLMQEFDELKNKYGVEEIQFMDDNLTINRDFIKELLTSMIKGNYNFKWCTPNGLFFNSLDDELLELMKESGCYQITLAVESGSKRMLKDVIKKSVALDKVKGIVDKAHELGMRVHGLFVVGLPGETKEELMQTFEFPFLNNFDSCSFSAATVFPGTRLEEICETEKFQVDKNSSYNYRTTNFIIPKGHEWYVMDRNELAELIDKVSGDFYDYSKEKFKNIYNEKYKKFIDKMGEDESVVKKRL